MTLWEPDRVPDAAKIERQSGVGLRAEAGGRISRLMASLFHAEVGPEELERHYRRVLAARDRPIPSTS